MQCKKCKSEWKTDRSISASLACCPFCGASLTGEDDGGPKLFDNSKEALKHIADTYGVDYLFDGSKLINVFIDYAPQLKKEKRLLRVVFEENAASVLKDNLKSQQADKEIAFKQAVTRLTDACIAQDAAESIIYELTDALGWKLNASTPTQQQPKPTSSTDTENNMPAWFTKAKKASEQKEIEEIEDTVAEILLGKRYNLQFGGYIWQALDVRGYKALLLTQDVIEKRPYNVAWEGTTWEKCTLRHYLNDEFYQTFSNQAQARILSTENTNENNQWFGTDGGNDTIDRVFLLSIEEVVRYFGDSGQLKNKNPNDERFIDDNFNKKRGVSSKNTGWWLRSPGLDTGVAAFVDSDGSLCMYGGIIGGGYGNEGAVRPALWLNLKS
jgi:CYTH domain-containing protein